jgi:co-chaperonin GroES (HSP10)
MIKKIQVIPVGKKILLRQKEKPKYYQGTTILIPETTVTKEYKGYVVAIGKEVQEINVGDEVQYADYAVPTKMLHDGTEHLLINVGDIFAILKEE